MAEGDVVAVVESMKMETSLTAPFAGRVRRVLSGTNVQVPARTPLLQLEAIEDEVDDAAERVSFEDETASSDASAAIDRLRFAMLGYDVSGDEVRRALAVLRECDTDVTDAEHKLLDVFTDVRALTRARHDDPERELLHSPQEYMHAFLRSLDAKAERLPERFVTLLQRALSHYGVDSLDRTPALEDACYRLFVSQGRADLARAAVMAILEKRIERADELVGKVGDGFRGVLDRLELATERRDPVIADHARQLRTRYFDRPVIDAAPGPGLRRSGAPPRRAAGGPGSRRTARTTCAPSSRRRSCSPRS